MRLFRLLSGLGFGEGSLLSNASQFNHASQTGRSDSSRHRQADGPHEPVLISSPLRLLSLPSSALSPNNGPGLTGLVPSTMTALKLLKQLSAHPALPPPPPLSSLKIFFPFCRFFSAPLGLLATTPSRATSQLPSAPSLLYPTCSTLLCFSLPHIPRKISNNAFTGPLPDFLSGLTGLARMHAPIPSLLFPSSPFS